MYHRTTPHATHTPAFQVFASQVRTQVGGVGLLALARRLERVLHFLGPDDIRNCCELSKAMREQRRLELVGIGARRAQELRRDVADGLQTIVKLGQGLYMRAQRGQFGRRGGRRCRRSARAISCGRVTR